MALIVWFAGVPSRRAVTSLAVPIVHYLYETNGIDTVDVASTCWTGLFAGAYEIGTAWDWHSNEWVSILRKPTKPNIESQVGRYDRSRYENNGRADDSRNAKAQQPASASYRKVIFNDGSIRFVDEARASEPRRTLPHTQSQHGKMAADEFKGLSMDSRSMIGDQTTADAMARDEQRALGQNTLGEEVLDSAVGQPSELTEGSAM